MPLLERVGLLAAYVLSVPLGVACSAGELELKSADEERPQYYATHEDLAEHCEEMGATCDYPEERVTACTEGSIEYLESLNPQCLALYGSYIECTLSLDIVCDTPNVYPEPAPADGAADDSPVNGGPPGEDDLPPEIEPSPCAEFKRAMLKCQYPNGSEEFCHETMGGSANYVTADNADECGIGCDFVSANCSVLGDGSTVCLCMESEARFEIENCAALTRAALFAHCQ